MICGDVTIVLHCSIWSNQKCICSELTHSVKIEGLRFCPYKLHPLQEMEQNGNWDS